MKFLLDSCVALWLAVEPEKLSKTATLALSDGYNTLCLSSVSTWEIAFKYGLGKLSLPDPPQILIPQLRAEFNLIALPFDEDAAVLGGTLPYHHKDPFDRMLVSIAIVNGLQIVTPDVLIREYPIRTLW
jgi:PIN domain nuclease of toxin-antitoxin system